MREKGREKTEEPTFTNILAITTIWLNVRGDHDVPCSHAGFCFQSKSIHVAEKLVGLNYMKEMIVAKKNSNN